MSEPIIWETIAENRAREILVLNDRVAKLEGRLDVLTTRLEYLTRDSVTKDDLEKLWKRVVRYVANAMREMLSGFGTRLDAHGADIKQSGRKHTRIVMRRAADEAAKTRRRLLQYGLLITGLVLAITGKDGAFAVVKWAMSGFTVY